MAAPYESFGQGVNDPFYAAVFFRGNAFDYGRYLCYFHINFNRLSRFVKFFRLSREIIKIIYKQYKQFKVNNGLKNPGLAQNR